MIFIAGLSYLAYIKKREIGIDYLKGQWKITELAAIQLYGRIYWSEEEYLGRSISISPGKIERSIGYWPFDLNRSIGQYEYWTSEQTMVYDWAGKAGISNITGWYDEYMDEIVNIISFYKKEDDFKKGYDPVEVYILFEDGSVQTQYIEGWYKIERFLESKTNLSIEELWGTWNVERFISYKDDWIGNRKQLELCRKNIESFAPELSGWEETEGIDFYPKDYYGYSLLMDRGKISIMSGNETIEEHKIQKYEEKQADKKIYEQEKGIHDELGISNEKIEVIVAGFVDRDGSDILDNEIVVVDETRIIIKIEDGWFLLTRNFDI